MTVLVWILVWCCAAGEINVDAINIAGGKRPVNAGFRLVDLFGVGHALIWLRCGCEPIVKHMLERFNDGGGAKGGQFVVEMRCGVGRFDIDLVHQQHVTRIKPFIHLHDGDACLTVTCHNGAVNGGRSAPARQQ